MKQYSLIILFLILVSCSLSNTIHFNKLYNSKHAPLKPYYYKNLKERTNTLSKYKETPQKRNNKTSHKFQSPIVRNEKSQSLNEETKIFYQKVYTGTNPSLIISLSEPEFKMYSITVNKQLLILKTILHSEENKEGEIFDTTVLNDLYIEGIDEASSNNCCTRVKAIDYQECSGDCRNTGLIGFLANHCLEITEKTFTKRICSEKKSTIERLHFHIREAVVTLFNPKINYRQLIMNSFATARSLKNWDWHNQMNWEGNCINSSMNLQSPIILDNPQDQISINFENKEGQNELPPKLTIDYFFEEFEPVITIHGREAIIGITSYAGHLRLKSGEKTLTYQPNFISFKFRSEHQIASKRFDGEVAVHFTELNPDKKSWITGGLVVSFLLEKLEDAKSLKFLESLKIDFWKLELKEKKKSKYEPGNSFCIGSWFDEVLKQNSNYYLYKGSLTTPPCTSNVLRLIFDKSVKIPEIQFNALRQQSLLDQRENEVHARVIQKSFQREVLKDPCSNITFNKNLNFYIETELSDENISASRVTNNNASGENIFSPARRDSIRDSFVKFRESQTVEQLERRMKEAQKDSEIAMNEKSDSCE